MEETPYNPGAMRVLMSAALGVGFDETSGDEDEVTCVAQSVTVPCSEAGATTLVDLAQTRMTTADQTRNTANLAFDQVYAQFDQARGMAGAMRDAAAQASLAPPQEG